MCKIKSYFPRLCHGLKSIQFAAIIAAYQFSIILSPLILKSNPQPINYSGLKFNIFLSKEFFSHKESIYVNATVSNLGDEPILFRPVSIPHTTFRLVVRDKKGMNLPLKETWILQGENKSGKEGAGDPYDREGKYILLESGETFSRKLNLQELYDLEPEKSYFLQGYFYPDFVHQPKTMIKSVNWRKFQTKPLDELTAEQGKMALESEIPLVQTDVTPDEVVFLHLKAEAEKSPGRFLKYLSLVDYIQVFDRFVNQYNESSPDGKIKVLELFKKFLVRKRYDYLIDFRIKRTEFISRERSKSNVYVQVLRYGGARPDIYEYIYTLKPVDSQKGWLITHLRVTRKKTIF